MLSKVNWCGWIHKQWRRGQGRQRLSYFQKRWIFGNIEVSSEINISYKYNLQTSYPNLYTLYKILVVTSLSDQRNASVLFQTQWYRQPKKNWGGKKEGIWGLNPQKKVLYKSTVKAKNGSYLWRHRLLNFSQKSPFHGELQLLFWHQNNINLISNWPQKIKFPENGENVDHKFDVINQGSPRPEHTFKILVKFLALAYLCS